MSAKVMSDEVCCDAPEEILVDVEVQTDPCNIHLYTSYWPVEDGNDVGCHFWPLSNSKSLSLLMVETIGLAACRCLFFDRIFCFDVGDSVDPLIPQQSAEE